MKLKIPDKKHIVLFITSIVVLTVGAYLFNYSYSDKPYSEDLLIWDAIWLDFWALLFLFSLLVIWHNTSTWKVRAPLLIGLFSIYGFIAMCLFLDGTPFGLNAIWGDQKFRITMILKFMNWYVPGDFFYKDLSSFYPPVYFYLLSIIARVFSFDAYMMIKEGSLLIYFAGPVILYYFWSKLVSNYRAYFIVLVTFLFCSIGKAIPLGAPHAFIANALFIPWWLYYIEQIKKPISGFIQYLLGGLIGALIFLTYYYPFFIGGFLILLRFTFFRKWIYLNKLHTFQWKSSLLVLCISGMLSSPFWIPLLYDMITFGNNAAQQEWHHMGSTGIAFEFQEFTIFGFLYLGSIIFSLRHYSTKLNRSLLLLMGTIPIFYLIGTFFGAVGHPVNLIKANEFMIILSGPFIGLAIASLLRFSNIRKKLKPAIIVFLVIILGIFLNGFNGLIHHPMIKTARTTNIPGWNFNENDLSEFRGKVFLSDYEELTVIHPIYCFIAHNQHYAHPASRHIQRYCFLKSLQNVDDPYMFNLALRYNVFDKVDYFMLRKQGNQFKLTLSLSNYPNKYSTHTLIYNSKIISDTSLFSKIQGDNLYKVVDKKMSLVDSSISIGNDKTFERLMSYKLIRNYLNDEGQTLWDNRIGIDWNNWNPLKDREDKISIDGKIDLLDAYSLMDGDTLHILMAFYFDYNFNIDYRIFLHVYPGHGDYSFDNFDFAPEPGINTLRRGDIIIYKRSVPYHTDYDKLHVGCFNKDGRLGEGLWMLIK